MKRLIATIGFAPVLFLSYKLENMLRGGYKDNSRTVR